MLWSEKGRCDFGRMVRVVTLLAVRMVEGASVGSVYESERQELDSPFELPEGNPALLTPCF